MSKILNVGLDVGSTTVKVVVLNENLETVECIMHDFDSLSDLLDSEQNILDIIFE